MAKNQWTIKPESAGQRLDVFLADKMPDTTRSAISKKLKAGAGSIDGKKAAVHTFLKVGQKVEYRISNIEDRLPTFSVAMNRMVQGGADIRHSAERTFDIRKFIIKETPDWIVVNKPAGLLVHPDSQHEDGTLIDVLIAHFPPLAKVGEDPSRPGVVHRLDKEVSGLMVLAKTQDAYDNFKQQFSHHQTKKVYLALVQGAPPKEDGDIRFRIARSGTHARMAARPESDPRGKVAWSHYRVLKRIKNATLLEVEILSGRTHQIRAHLFALGCPVMGDQLYKTSNLQERVDARHPARLMLQSVELTFDDPKTGERLTFSVPPDPSFEKFMKN